MTTGNMDLTIPVVGTTVGPTWATQINTALETISDHTHTSGDGSLITPAAININADLPLNGWAATDAEYFGCTDQAAVLADSNIAYALYSVGGNMYWRTSGGTDVQITDGSGLNFSSLGVIGGDYGQPGVNASVIYTDSTKLYSFYQSSGITAAVLMGSLKLSNQVSGSNVVTISTTDPTASMTLTLPAALPGGQTFMQMAASGAITYSSTFSAAVTFSSTLTVAGATTFGTDGVADVHRYFGASVKFKADTTTGAFVLLGDRVEGSLVVSATDSGAAAQIRLYGLSHATLASNLEFRSASARTGIVTSAGLWTFGASGYTGVHAINGGLTISTTLAVAGASTLASASITGAATVGTTLGVTGATTLSSTLSAGASTLASATITGAATVGTTLGVTGASTLASVGVTGAATVGTTLGVTGNITAAANIVMSNGAGSYTAPRILVTNNNGDVTGIGVYRNGTSPSGMGIVATASNAFLYFTANGGTTPYILMNVVAATGVINIGSASFATVAHNLEGSLNFNATAALPADGIGRSAGNQLSITTASTERIRVTNAAVTVRNALIAESTLAVTGVATFSANPAGTIVSGSYSPTLGAVSGTAGTNLDAQYQRIGNIVTVFGRTNWTANASGQIAFNISLPVAPNNNFDGSATQGYGLVTVFGSGATGQIGGRVSPVSGASTMRAEYKDAASSAIGTAVQYTFSYTIDT